MTDIKRKNRSPEEQAARNRSANERVDALVAKMKAKEKPKAKAQPNDFERGRLQGLEKALAVTVPSTSWGTEGLPQKFAEAIEALMGEEQ